jgi:hypothetical protein
VQFAGQQWVERFDLLYNRLPKKLLAHSQTLPTWLKSKPQYSIWERNNAWMLNSAINISAQDMSFIAVWDGKGGDGPGGTAHMVEEVKKRGGRVIIIDVNNIQNV